MRQDGRAADELRPIVLTPDYTENPLGSVLCEYGKTKVLCTVSEELSVPRWLRGTGKGWLTSEYSLLPGSTDRRVSREATRGKISGRTAEIQRLIGRGLRAAVDLERLGERTLWVDCDVLQADGGTRTASITGAYAALAIAINRIMARGELTISPIPDAVAAVSVGIVDGEVRLDLPYEEDSRAEVDMNIVGTGSGKLVEVQGTGEDGTFSMDQLMDMTRVAQKGIAELIEIQSKAIAAAGK
ncbi:MAG: ribonuclease PH [Deltaproteobacteria bacterium]|nr:ribonuclease PH [Deltaproteobacteria bacterium]